MHMRRALALALAAAATVVGLGGPATAGAPGDDDAATGNTFVVVDTSGSMEITTRFDAAKAGVTAYMSALPPDLRVGLVSFSTRPRVVVEPTADRSKVFGAVATLTPEGRTSLYDAVTMTLDLAEDEGIRNVLLISDGRDSSSTATLAATLKKIRSAGIRVDAVDVRPRQKPTKELVQLAAAGGGEVVTADDAGELAKLLSELSQATRGAELPPPAKASLSGGFKIFLLALFLGLVLSALLVLQVTTQSRADRLQRMMLAYGHGGAKVPGNLTAESLAGRSAVVDAFYGVAGRMAASESLGGRLTGLLLRANLRLKPAEWLIIEFSAGSLVGALMWLVSGNLVLGLLGGLVGLLAPFGWLSFVAGRRTRQFSDRLPDALQLLASSIASGFGLSQACDAVARGGPEPVNEEFTKAMVDVRLGLSVTDALGRVAARMQSPDLKLTVMSIGIQHEVGGNLAEVLRNTVATMRERAYLRRQIKTLSAEGRLSAYILTALPIFMGLYLFLLRRDYVRPLYTEPVGLMMLFGATTLVVIGMLIMRKMVRLEV